MMRIFGAKCLIGLIRFDQCYASSVWVRFLEALV